MNSASSSVSSSVSGCAADYHEQTTNINITLQSSHTFCPHFCIVSGNLKRTYDISIVLLKGRLFFIFFSFFATSYLDNVPQTPKQARSTIARLSTLILVSS